MPGPMPKRSEERRRRNKDAVDVTKVDLDTLIAGDVEIPTVPMHEVLNEETGELTMEPRWDPLTVQFYESFSKSGQAIFYEPTDWMTIYTTMEVLDRWLKPQDVKVGQTGSAGAETGGGDIEYVFEPKIVAMPGSVLTAILKALSSVMATEGDRRRLRIELERKKAQDAILAEASNVVSIVQHRQDLFGQASRGS